MIYRWDGVFWDEGRERQWEQKIPGHSSRLSSLPLHSRSDLVREKNVSKTKHCWLIHLQNCSSRLAFPYVDDLSAMPVVNPNILRKHCPCWNLNIIAHARMGWQVVCFCGMEHNLSVLSISYHCSRLWILGRFPPASATLMSSIEINRWNCNRNQ